MTESKLVDEHDLDSVLAVLAGLDADADSVPNLDDLRAAIDGLDARIQRSISQRAGLARMVGKAKGPLKAAIDYYRPDREAQVLRRVKERNQGPLNDDELLRVFREVMSACLAQQDPLKIAYLGPEGTFTQQASFKHFGHSIHGLAMVNIEEVFQEVEAGHADFGVVPVENSSEGAVHSTLDSLLDTSLKICGEIELRVNQHLMSRTSDLKSIQRIYSHPQSLAQCKAWIRANLPDAEKVPVSSNAEAARRARDNPESAAIASESAAHVYGLPIVAGPIQDRPDNTTRFLVMGREILSPSGSDKTSLLLLGHDQAGSLYHLLHPLAQNNISMTRIESRPARKGMWENCFFIDVVGHIEDANLVKALSDLGPVADQVRVLGSYPTAIL